MVGCGDEQAAEAGDAPQDKYRRKTVSLGPLEQTEVRLSTNSKVSMVLKAAIRILEADNTKNGTRESLLITASGNAIGQAVELCELVKRDVPGLHQVTDIGTVVITDVYVPLEEGLDEVKHDRNVSFIRISLNRNLDNLNPDDPGYQAPRQNVEAPAAQNHATTAAQNHATTAAQNHATTAAQNHTAAAAPAAAAQKHTAAGTAQKHTAAAAAAQKQTAAGTTRKHIAAAAQKHTAAAAQKHTAATARPNYSFAGNRTQSRSLGPLPLYAPAPPNLSVAALPPPPSYNSPAWSYYLGTDRRVSSTAGASFLFNLPPDPRRYAPPRGALR